MNQEIFVLQKYAPLQRRWVQQGNRNHPLECVWVEVGETREATHDSNRAGDGGVRLCA